MSVVALLLMHYVVRMFWQDPKDGRIAVFAPPPGPRTTDFIKRVMAALWILSASRTETSTATVSSSTSHISRAAQRPEYELEIKDFQIVVDGIPLDASRAVVPPRSAWQAPDRIPAGYYLMLGDNRNDSDDGHLWGFLARNHFVVHAFVVFWPLAHMKVLY